MIVASQLRAGMAIRYEGPSYKVIAAEYHPGQGKMGGTTHVRLQNTDTGTFWEHSFRSDLKLEDVAVEKRPLEVSIAETARPVHQQQDNTLKPAKLANGVEIMVPQFIKNGDAIRLDLRTMKYMDRVKGEARARHG